MTLTVYNFEEKNKRKKNKRNKKSLLYKNINMNFKTFQRTELYLHIRLRYNM